MAKPIKETPVLRGKDAIKFEQKIRGNEKVPLKEYLRAIKNYNKIKRILWMEE